MYLKQYRALIVSILIASLIFANSIFAVAGPANTINPTGMLSEDGESVLKDMSNNNIVIYPDTLSLIDNKKEFKLMEIIGLKIKVDSKVMLKWANIYLVNEAGQTYSTGEFDRDKLEKNGLLEWYCPAEFYGKTYVSHIEITDNNGNTKTLRNSALYNPADDPEPDPSIIYADLSSADLTVIGGGVSSNIVIHPDTLSLIDNKHEFGLTESIGLNIKVESDVNIKWAIINYINEAGQTYGTGEFDRDKFEKNGLLEWYCPAEYYGKTYVSNIEITDFNGNTKTLHNSVHNNPANDPEPDPSIIYADLSSADLTVIGGGVSSNIVIHPDTLSLIDNKHEFGLTESIGLNIKVESDVNIKWAIINYINEAGQTYGTGEFDRDKFEKNGLLEWYCPAEYYGKTYVSNIEITDFNGNTKTLHNSVHNNPANDPEPDPSIIYADLSSIEFDVGILDPHNIFVFGDGMESGVTLSVNELDKEGVEYDLLNDTNLYDYNFYQINMNGTYNKNNHKVIIRFHLGDHIPDGWFVTIKHLLKNLSIQSIRYKVVNGMAEIEVDEFSPFLIETDYALNNDPEKDPEGNDSNTPYDNKPMSPSIEERSDFKILYCHDIPFFGNSKVTPDYFGGITVSLNNIQYKVSAIKINKKKRLMQITSLEGADPQTNKAIRKATKGKNRLKYNLYRYFVKNTDVVNIKQKSDGTPKTVKVKINGKYYKAKKEKEWNYNTDTCTVNFFGNNLDGSYTIP